MLKTGRIFAEISKTNPDSPLTSSNCGTNDKKQLQDLVKKRKTEASLKKLGYLEEIFIFLESSNPPLVGIGERNRSPVFSM